MIVRILGEGQLDVPADKLAELNTLDAAVEAAVSAADQDRFAEALAALLDGVRAAGSPLPDEALDDSDFILPHADASIAEVRELLTGEGLIPG